MIVPRKPLYFPLLQAIPLLLILISLILLPYWLINRHSSSNPSQMKFRFENQQIISPITQNQNLRYLSLSNDLNVLLISDPDTSKSGCAIQVNAGSLDEPNEVMGLAHFLEHMLFQGSGKYPSNDYFDDYLSKSEGDTNAFTGDTTTTFYFQVQNKAIEEGLDIFAHFFIDARLDPSTVEREIYAVNSEYQMDLQKNEWRFIELLRKMSNKASPYHRFSIGNYKTLKLIPESMNLSLYDELRKFYNKYYSSDKMSLCVISNQTLDQLESSITQKFGQIPRRSGIENYSNSMGSTQFVQEKTEDVLNFLNLNMRKKSKGSQIFSDNEKNSNFLNLISSKKNEANKEMKRSPDAKPAFSPDNLGKYVWYKTMGDRQELSVVFVINNTVFEDSFTRSWDYLTELISNNYPNGFKNYLIGKGLINDLDAGIESAGADFFMYIFRFDLTSDGFNAINDLINNVFSLIGFITNQGVNQSIYNEKSLISYINFLYRSKEELSDEMLELLQKIGVDLQDIYVSGQVYMKYNSDIMKYWLSQLQPTNALYVIGSNDFQINNQVEKIAFKKKEPYFRESNNTNNNQWEIYDDFIQEVSSSIYRLKTPSSEPKTNKINLENSNKVDNRVANLIKQKLSNKQMSTKLRRFIEKNSLCKPKKNNKDLLKKQSTDDNNSTFSTWLYSQKLNKLDDVMKIYYRIENVDPNQLLTFSAAISNYLTLAPQDLQIYQQNNFIPNDLSIIDDQCVDTKITNSAQLYQQRTLSMRNFTEPIDYLIKNHKNNNGNSNSSFINSTCFDEELQKDHEFKTPDLISQTNQIEVWLKRSREFGLPQGKINLLFFYPSCGLESFVLELLAGKLSILMNNDLINAKILGYDLDISNEPIGLKVTFQGFHDKLPDFVRSFVDKLKNTTFEESEYNAVKMLYFLQDLMGSSGIQPMDQAEGQPLEQAEYILKYALHGPNKASYSEYLKNSDYNAVLRTLNTFKQSTKLKALFFGNILQNDVNNMMSLLQNNFPFLDENTLNYTRTCVYDNNEHTTKIPDDVTLVYRAQNTNLDDSNHAIINYYQYGLKDPLAQLKLRAFSSTFNLKAFDFLRQSNQLGYVVFSQTLTLGGVLGLAVFVQGSKKNPLEMDGLIEDFLGNFADYFSTKPEEEINQEFINMDYDIFQKKNKDFYAKSDAYWKEIFEGNYNFEKVEIKRLLYGLTKNDILEFYSNLVKKNQRKLSVQIWGNNANTGNSLRNNETLSSSRNNAGKTQKIINDFSNLEKYTMNDNKLTFYQV